MPINAACKELLQLLDLPADAQVEMTGHEPVLPTRFALADTAAAVHAAIGVAANEIWRLRGGGSQRIGIDLLHAAAALNSYRYHRIVGGLDPMTGFSTRFFSGASAIYPTRDGRYFHTHGSFDTEGMCAALGVIDPTVEKLAAAVGNWDSLELESMLAGVGRCGAMIRSADEWAAHPHGQALARKPVVEVLRIGDSDPEPFPAGERPLACIRVLDLTRVLAGPTCARTLAEHGAEVLRIGAAHLPTHEFFDMDTGHGKRWAHLDLKQADQRATLESLVAGADVFSEGFRPGAVARLGFAPEVLMALRPGIVSVSINCYGHEGPFADRPGWEQLGQSVSGMAHEEGGEDAPRLVPAAACDYTTGYLAALGVLVALLRRAREGGSYRVRVSLARTGMWYVAQPRVAADAVLPSELPSREAVSHVTVRTDTGYGPMLHLAPVAQMSETPTRWDLPVPLAGSSPAVWTG